MDTASLLLSHWVLGLGARGYGLGTHGQCQFAAVSLGARTRGYGLGTHGQYQLAAISLGARTRGYGLGTPACCYLIGC